MPSRRAVIATVAAVGVAGCSSVANQTGPVTAATTGKRIEATLDGEWRPVARCEPDRGHDFGYEEVPVDVPLAVRREEGAMGGSTPFPRLPDHGPLVAEDDLLEDLRDGYGSVRFGLSLTAIEENEVDGHDPGTETTYWVARGSFNRTLVGDRVTFRPSEADPRGIESITDVTSIRDDRG